MSKVKLVSVTVGKLLPNPYRNIDDYPFHKEKVEALKESFEATDFWDNLMARPKGAKFEIAFGHHRLRALQEKYGLRHKCQVLVRDMSNADMLRMMIRENLEEWGSDAWVEMEAVKQTIAAYDAGAIELPKMPAKANTGNLHACPTSGKHYSKVQIARFCGMMKNDTQPTYAFENAWDAIQAQNDEIITPKVLKNLSREEAAVVVSNATREKKRVEKEAKAYERDGDLETATAMRKRATQAAKVVATESAKALRDGEGVRAVRAHKMTTVNPRPVDLDQFCLRVEKRINKLFDPESQNNEDSLIGNLKLIRKYRNDASASSITSVQKCLDKLVRRIQTQKVSK